MQNPQVVQTGIFDLITQSGPIVQLVLLILVAASIFCWSIIFVKQRNLNRATDQDVQFLDAFWNGKNMEEISSKAEGMSASPVASVFRSGFRELKKLPLEELKKLGTIDVQTIERALARASNSEITQLERNLGWLATTASSAPFIGLFGTVWGIMTSFHSISQTGNASLAVVAPGISEALIATAVGLFAAIPAVIAYNHFVNKIKRIATDIDCFSQDFLNIVQRSLMTNRSTPT